MIHWLKGDDLKLLRRNNKISLEEANHIYYHRLIDILLTIALVATLMVTIIKDIT